MARGNTVTLVGNLTRDPELRYTPGGAAVANVGIAVNERWQDKATQEWREKGSFYDLVIWNKQAENAAESLVKGDRVIVHGNLDQRSWQADDGTNRYKVEVRVDVIAPSCEYATVEITKNPKTEGQESRYGEGPRTGGSPAGGGGKRRTSSAPPPGGGEYDYDEEPF